jgi:PAS domain S-box-containing protein
MTDGEPPTFDLTHFFDTDVAFFSIAGHDGYFKRSNAAFERMLGWPEPELLSKSFYELIHPDDTLPMRRPGTRQPGISPSNTTYTTPSLKSRSGYDSQ